MWVFIKLQIVRVIALKTKQPGESQNFQRKGDWLKIRTQEGLVGYVLRKNIIDYYKEPDVMSPLATERKAFSKYKKINVTWIIYLLMSLCQT